MEKNVWGVLIQKPLGKSRLTFADKNPSELKVNAR